MLNKALIVFVLFGLNLYAKTINVATSANVSYAINDLKKSFNKIYPNIKVQTILGSSGKLTAQIKNGAPYDIFLSANMKYPQSLYDDKLTISKPIIYAKGLLALLTNKHINFNENLDFLENDNINKIAIANPLTAPYGKATVEVFKNLNIHNSIKSKLIYGESISQTVVYATKASDIGIVAKSSLFSKKMKKYKKNINWFDISPKLYTPINQGVVLLSNAKNKEEAKLFYDFILSSKAKDIFKQYGYLTK